ncbi:hypothetical protein [Thermococcus sp.]
MTLKKIWDSPVLLQPLKMESALERWLSDETPIAKQTWVFGPKKPRDQLRKEELPPKDLHIEKLVESGLIHMLPQIKIKKRGDVKSILDDADLLVIGDMEDWMAPEEILDELALLKKPIMPDGYSIHGRLSKFRFDKYSEVKHIIPMGADDVLGIISAIKGIKALRTLKVLYIGISVKVKDSKTISKMGFGHHVVLVYGRYKDTLKRSADLTGFEFYRGLTLNSIWGC